jgi:hypothetical protein
MGISLLGILLIAGVAFVAVVILLVMLIGLANKNFPVLIWFAVPLMILMVLTPVLYWRIASRPPVQSTPSATQWNQAMQAVQTPAVSEREELPLAWDDAVRGKANVYPSVADCGKQLARILAKDLDREAGTTDRIELVLKGSIPIPEEFGDDFVEEMNGLLVNKPLVMWASESKKADATKVNGIEFKERNDLDFTRVVINCEHEIALSQKPNEFGFANECGTIICDWKKDDGKKNNAASFDYETKPWLTDTKQFLVKNKRYKWLVGRSRRFANSPEDAAVDAFSNVNMQLMADDRLSIKSVFKSKEMMERNVADRFVQKISMPYGDVWREAVLICLDPPNGINGLEALPNDLANVSPPEQWSTVPSGVKGIYSNPSQTGMKRIHRAPISPESALAMLAGFVVLIGLVSNLLTQGYYQHQITTTVVMAIGLIVCVLAGIVFMFVVGRP